uniref:Uncharacterized protein n=1 Tax=Oryza sativa subsp. japonica TaxID=39947 RepID=Q69UY2_ORYSJ|nr:hypothetical protein [Oryza sativa Japonica Group]
MKLQRIPMPTTRREMKTMALTMNSCVPDYLIQGNGTVYTNDFCYKNGGLQLGEGGNKVFGKRLARLLPVRPRQLVFLFTHVLRAFVDARNRE